MRYPAITVALRRSAKTLAYRVNGFCELKHSQNALTGSFTSEHRSELLDILLFFFNSVQLLHYASVVSKNTVPDVGAKLCADEFSTVHVAYNLVSIVGAKTDSAKHTCRECSS